MKQQLSITLIVTALIACSSGNKDKAPTKTKTEGSKPEAKVPAKVKQNMKRMTSPEDVKKVGFPKSAFEYAKMCEPELGVPPRVNLDKSVEIPVYVDGVQAFGEFFSCDNPVLIGKSTVSGSTLQRYEGRTADGKPLPDVIWIAFGRY